MLSEALRLIRIYHDLKQRELAEKLSVSTSYLSEIESGKKVPTMDLVMKYAKEFRIPASSILFFSENVNEPARIKKMRGFIAKKIIQYLQVMDKNAESEEL